MSHSILHQWYLLSGGINEAEPAMKLGKSPGPTTTR